MNWDIDFFFYLSIYLKLNVRAARYRDGMQTEYMTTVMMNEQEVRVKWMDSVSDRDGL